MMWVKFKVTKIVYGILYTLMLLNLASVAHTQSRNFDANQNRKRTVSDPVSNFFSELGDMFLDVDQAFAVQTAPKVQYQDGLVSQIFRPTNEYFNRIQNNYKTIQSRLGRLIGDTLGPKTTYSESELSTVSPPAGDAKEKDEMSTSISDNAGLKSGLITSSKEDQTFSATQKTSTLENSDNQDGECSGKALDNPFLEHLRKEECTRKNRNNAEEQIRKAMEKLMLDTQRATKLLIPLGSRALGELSNDFVKRQGDIESDDSKPQTRIIGDVLYSESLFDKQLRQLLKRHGQWILDNPLLTRWRRSSEATTEDSTRDTTDYSTQSTEFSTEDVTSDVTTEEDSTEAYVPTSTEYRAILSKSGKSIEETPLPLELNYYQIKNNDVGRIGEEVDIVFEPQSEYVDDGETGDTETDDIEELEEQDTVILAFTPDGVPLKLRMGPEISNPIRYLHRVLRSGGVSLNVPVESYDDLEPVGREVLKLGSGILTRAVYIDMTNNNELKSLLKTLMKSKASGKTNF